MLARSLLTFQLQVGKERYWSLAVLAGRLAGCWLVSPLALAIQDMARAEQQRAAAEGVVGWGLAGWLAEWAKQERADSQAS